MDLYSDFCNICYKSDEGSLKHISEENMKHLKDTLITFVGHADIINHNIINLCHLCCEELTRSNKFRNMCLTNLIQLRQRVFDMKSKLELEGGTCNVQNTLQSFIREDLRKNTLEKSNCAVSKPMEYEIVKSSADLSTNESVFNRKIINVESEINECEFVGDCSDVAAECDESQVPFTHFMFVKCEREFDEDYESMKEYSDDFALRNFSSKSGGHVNLDNVPGVNNSKEIVNSGIESTRKELKRKQENSTSEDLILETSEDESGDNLKFAFESVKVEYSEGTSISNEENNIKLPNTLAAATTDAQPNHPDVREYVQSSAHNWVYPSMESHTCTVCNKSFTTSRCLTRHARTHTQGSPYKCTICNKTFTRPASLTSHKRIHSGDRPFECTVCNKTFNQLPHLTSHLRIHSENRPYKCTVCNKTFTQSANLTTHERIHSGTKPYKCTVCNKTFTHSANLNSHQRIHTGDRPFKCTVCNKTFNQLPHLTSHQRIHSGARPYKCSVCNKTFTQSSNLNIHERIHSGTRPYQCTVCNKTFTQSASLAKHQLLHSGNKT